MIHFIIGHKETRFLYPIAGFLPIIIIKGIEIIKGNWSPDFVNNNIIRIFAKIFWTINFSLIIIVFFIPADSQVNLYRTIFHNYPYPITLYYISEDPYNRALEISYYKRKDLSIKKTGLEAIPDSIHENKYLIAITSRDMSLNRIRNLKQVYSTYPEWIKYFNVNHWLDRTQVWYLYENVK